MQRAEFFEQLEVLCQGLYAAAPDVFRCVPLPGAPGDTTLDYEVHIAGRVLPLLDWSQLSGDAKTKWAGVGEVEEIAALLGYQISLSTFCPPDLSPFVWAELTSRDEAAPEYRAKSESPLLALLTALLEHFRTAAYLDHVAALPRLIDAQETGEDTFTLTYEDQAGRRHSLRQIDREQLSVGSMGPHSARALLPMLVQVSTHLDEDLPYSILKAGVRPDRHGFNTLRTLGWGFRAALHLKEEV